MPEAKAVDEEPTNEEERWAVWRLKRAMQFSSHRTTRAAVKQLVCKMSPSPKQKEAMLRVQAASADHALVSLGGGGRVAVT